MCEGWCVYDILYVFPLDRCAFVGVYAFVLNGKGMSKKSFQETVTVFKSRVVFLYFNPRLPKIC